MTPVRVALAACWLKTAIDAEMISKLKNMRRVICFLSANLYSADHIMNQTSSAFFALRFGNNPNDRLGVRAPHEQPAIRQDHFHTVARIKRVTRKRVSHRSE